MKFADVIIDISAPNLDRTFTYEIPEELSDITPGTPVMIPFGKGNNLKKGYVVGVGSTKPRGDFEIKKIDSVVKSGLVIEDELMALAYKMKRNYGGMLKDSLRTVIPVKTSVSKNRINIRKEAFPEITELKEMYPEGISPELKLNSEQEAAAGRIKSDMDSGKRDTYLLFGVTGSGKTEVYMDVISHVIKNGKQVIVLIPEIALTYQTVSRFAKRFGKRVAFSHSRMSKGERYLQSESAKKGEIDIMIGPRSALFTPFTNLGLIIVDEEHEGGYKSDVTPKYHAREVAEWRAEMCGASLVLGSATPSLDSYRRAEKGEITLLKLDHRATGATFPNTLIVDMREEMMRGNKSVISIPLYERILKRLENKEQVMLFLNRRGYSGAMTCRKCGYVPKCEHCDIALTLHRDGLLHCHYCGRTMAKPVACPKCGSKAIAGFKAGTEKIEAMIARAFPSARILRMDADTTSKKGEYEKILSAFKNGKADILIGTQMIVKGHDFPKVTLVGILAADLSLFVSDYRAGERTYQLIAQAAGRAGRGELPGECVIQTYNPDNYCVTAAATNDYEEFYNEEILSRKIMGYPPEGNMLMIMIKSDSPEKNRRVAEKAAYAVKTYGESVKASLDITGPVTASVKKIDDIYRDVIYIKDKDMEQLIRLKDAVEYFFFDQKINEASLQFDFNPQ